MATTATARLTVGAIFGAISTAALSITSVLDATTDGVGMIHTFVNDAATKQSIRSVVDMDGFESALQDEQAQIMTSRQLGILEFRRQSKDHDELYTDNHARIGKLLEARRNARSKAA